MIEKLLQPLINLGLPEAEFWEMTVAELLRYQEGAVWRMRIQAQMMYANANLNGMSIARVLDSKADFPPIEEVFPMLFDKPKVDEQKEEEDLMIKSQNRFMEFALKHNSQMRKEGNNNGNDRRTENQDIS